MRNLLATFVASWLVFSVTIAQVPKNHILRGDPSLASTPSPKQNTTPLISRPRTQALQSCLTRSSQDRSCWSSGHNITSDFDREWPNTGRIRRYNLEISNTTCAPDGIRRTCLLINGQYPGPTIFGDWGDTIEVTLKNNLAHNGTGIHWHGVRQILTTTQDGAPGITECPLAPGDTKVYRWHAVQHGTSWYHSHYSVQYGDGVVGTIQINGPATAPYDTDLGVYPITDWYSSTTVFEFNHRANVSLQQGRGPPPGENILINGTALNAQGGGKLNQVILTPGKKHRVRLINTSVEAAIRVSLDNHPFEVITSDFVPIRPVTHTSLLMAIGQRYDVIITANQSASNYWFRAEAVNACATPVLRVGRAIFTYAGVTPSDPTTTGFVTPTDCSEPTDLVPFWRTVVPRRLFEEQAQQLNVDLTIPGVNSNTANIVSWTVNLTAIDIDWREPTLSYVANRSTNYPQTYNLIEIPRLGTWAFWIIQEPPNSIVPIPHPIHLHGHDMWLLGHAVGVFNASTDLGKLDWTNPTRRDVTILPAGGWTVIGFPADNPGAWLMHCHISTHISAGLGVQFLEAKDQIPGPDLRWRRTCQNWRAYYGGNPLYLKDDSGL